MPKDTAFVIYYLKKNIYSFNALIAALETDEKINDLDYFFFTNEKDLILGLNDIIKKYEKVVVGISFFTTQLWDINSLTKILRKRYGNNIMLIAGGPHPTGDPKGTLKIGFDVVVVGEGEETIMELFHDVDFKDIKGIAYINNEKKYYYTGARPPIDLEKYGPFPIKNVKFGAIEITRGCPYACYFCQTSHILGRRTRHRSIESICRYIKILKEYNKTDIRFISPNAFSYGSLDGKSLNIPQLEELLVKIKRIIAPDGRIFFGSFPSEVRPEHISEETLELVLKYAANDNITIGAQSGSQKVLDFCHRGHKIEDIYNAVELTIRAGLKINADFIFGLPKETEEDIDLTINVIKNLAKMGAKIHGHYFMPLPQTPFAKEPPGHMNEKLRKTIKELTSKGFAFGNWMKQEKIARKIALYMKTKKI